MFLPSIKFIDNLAIPVSSLATVLPTPAPAPAPIVIGPNTPTSIHAQKAEEVARTVYVGNLNPKVIFYDFFSLLFFLF